MPKEIQALGMTAAILYAQVTRDSDGKVWNTSGTPAFETYATANIANYAVAMTEAGTASGYFTGNFPSTISAGLYSVVVRVKATGSFLESDVAVASGKVHWSGTAVVEIAQTVDSNLKQILGTALTETSGLLAGGFKKFFNVATPTGTLNSLPAVIPGAADGLVIAGTNASIVFNNFTINGVFIAAAVQFTSFYVVGNTIFGGNLSVAGDFTTAGNFNVGGSLQVAVNFSVANVFSANDIAASNSLSVGSGGVMVTGNTLFTGGVYAMGAWPGITGIPSITSIADDLSTLQTNVLDRLPNALVGGRMDSIVGAVAGGAITDAAFTMPAEAAGEPTGALGMLRRVFERGLNKIVRTLSSGTYTVNLRNAADSGNLESRTQATTGSTGATTDTQTKAT